MSVTDNHLIDYLSGDSDAPLEPDDRETLDQLRALLADEATWVEPDPALEGRVLAAISDAAAQDLPPRRTLRPPRRETYPRRPPRADCRRCDCPACADSYRRSPPGWR